MCICMLGLQAGADGERRRKMGGEAAGEISGYGIGSDAC
jgi:hypothetical protein